MNNEELFKLINDSMDAAISGLKGEWENIREAHNKYPDSFSGLSYWGDNEDYSNAAIDQIRFFNQILSDQIPISHIDEIIIAKRDDIEGCKICDSCMGFIYGYADHSSPLSDMMACNHEDDSK